MFWPAFEERDGAVLLAGTRVTSPPEKFENLAAFERFFGHTHLFDEFRHAIPLIHDPEWDSDRPDAAHPEFAAAWELAKRIGQMWLAKLGQDFPNRVFRVYVTKLDDPIIHFHSVRAGERPWISDTEAAEAVARDELAVYVSRRPPYVPAS
ncbi:hypothetical protein [Gemmatirosa kalamazoonensis]|uniref:hypothetical protein n=1 Tax=Gemmatirosa kalamazoonensis TaxID=861299 RepID=UPI0011DE3169|nr:hypothetical protein [Gemmatirosa kalamazoonensis]